LSEKIGCIKIFQNNIKTYVYLGSWLQIPTKKTRKNEEILFVKNATLYAVIKVIILGIVPLGNTKMLQMLQIMLHQQTTNQTTCMYAADVIKNMHREWVYGDIITCVSR
jgi:hypothetical protein